MVGFLFDLVVVCLVASVFGSFFIVEGAAGMVLFLSFGFEMFHYPSHKALIWAFWEGQRNATFK